MPKSKMNMFEVPRILREAASKDMLRIVVIIGGVKASLLRYWLSQPNVLVIVIDNAVEIGRIRKRHRGKRFVTFVLGDGHTTHSVYSGTSEERRRASRLRANASLSSGFGGVGTNAELAAELLVASPAFREFLKSLPDQVFSRTKGKVSRIVLLAKGSMSGAANNGAKSVILREFVRSLLQVGIPAEVLLDQLGPMTFAGVAKRIRENYAFALFKTIYLMLQDPGKSHELATYRLDLHNLQPVSDNSELRDAWMLAEEVARDSLAMNEYIDLISTNDANDGVTGGISHRITDFMTGLHTVQHVAGTVASNLAAELQTWLDDVAPDPLLIQYPTWRNDSREQERESIEAILDRFSFSTDESIVDAIIKAPALYHFMIQIMSSEHIEFPMERLSTDFATTPESMMDFDRRLRLIRTFQERLHEELEVVRDDLDDVTIKISTATAKLDRIMDRLRRRNRFSGSLMAKLKLVAEVLRENWDRLHKLKAENQAIDRALSRVNHEWDHHFGTLASILKTLKSNIPTSLLEETTMSVATLFLNAAFAKLLQISELSVTDQIDLLCSLAGSVTAPGLALCVGSSSDRLEDIASAIVHGNYDVESPSHDARIRESAADKVLYAIPPVEPKLEALLTACVLKLDPDAKVTFYDSLMFGASVMRIRFQHFSCVGELFTGQVGHDLKVALEDPLAALDSAEVAKMLEFFDARIEGDRVVFPGPDRKLLL